jgi:D-3-phosphoglycerate dehydrogenase
MATADTNVLITCPPMVASIDRFRKDFEDRGVGVHCPRVVQVLSEAELIAMVPSFDGWIIGDDPATGPVFRAGTAGKLRAAVKWGVGVDNVDFDAARDCGIAVVNTPGMFGSEVADVAIAYLTGLARRTYEIDRGVRAGRWPKPVGTSLTGKTIGLVGLGDIGKATLRRLAVFDVHVIGYDPYTRLDGGAEGFEAAEWPARLEEVDCLIFTCALTSHNRHMLNADTLTIAKDGLKVINVARGPLIDEVALVAGLRSGKVAGVALDVFEEEPMPQDSPLREFESCVFGSHNASNTVEAVDRTSREAMTKLFSALGA